MRIPLSVWRFNQQAVRITIAHHLSIVQPQECAYCVFSPRNVPIAWTLFRILLRRTSAYVDGLIVCMTGGVGAWLDDSVLPCVNDIILFTVVADTERTGDW
jgi:hypothetical protein